MDVKKMRLPYTDGIQTKQTTPVKDLNHINQSISSTYSMEEKVELLGRLPAFAPKPVCKFIINGQTLFGKLEHKQETTLFIRHKFGKKVVKYQIDQLQSVDILKY